MMLGFRRVHSTAYCRGVVDRLLYVDFLDKYVSCGRDGTFRLWNGNDTRHFKTIQVTGTALCIVQ